MEYLKQNTLSYKTLNFSRRYVSYRGLDLDVCFYGVCYCEHKFPTIRSSHSRDQVTSR